MVLYYWKIYKNIINIFLKLVVSINKIHQEVIKINRKIIWIYKPIGHRLILLLVPFQYYRVIIIIIILPKSIVKTF